MGYDMLPHKRQIEMYTFSSRNSDGTWGGEMGMGGGAPCIIAYGRASAIRQAWKWACEDAAYTGARVVSLLVTDLWHRPIFDDGRHHNPSRKRPRREQRT